MNPGKGVKATATGRTHGDYVEVTINGQKGWMNKAGLKKA